jgi:hypothetical protein
LEPAAHHHRLHIEQLQDRDGAWAFKNDTPQSLEDLQPFEASVRQALAEMSALLVGAGSATE